MTDTQRIIDIYDKQAATLAAQYDAVPSADAIGQAIPPAERDALALDVGAGIGRDAEQLVHLGYDVVAVEPAEGMRNEGQRRHGSEHIRWVDDRLPTLSQVHRMGLLYDVILLTAVWQHIAPAERPRAFRKLITLMKPGALLLMTLRNGPSPPDRPMHPTSVGEVESLARAFGLEILRMSDKPDAMGRAEVQWTAVSLRMPDDGSGALPLIRGIILSDDKASTYKLGLLRSLSRIAVYAPAAADPIIDGDAVELPLGLVALYWIRLYLPLVRLDLPQMPRNRGPDGLGFAKVGFRALLALGVAAQDLRVGASFNEERGAAVKAAIGEAATTIERMPANFTRFPNSNSPVFETERSGGSRGWGAISLDLEELRGWGYLRVPGPVWRAMTRLDSWIEPVLISEWSRLIRNYSERMGFLLEPGVVEAALAWQEPARDTALGRAAVGKLLSEGSIVCVWSGAKLDQRNFDIDHCLPWTVWPCGDLWNLMPANRRLNQDQKRNRLPSARALGLAKDRILSWWEQAWLADPALEARFFREAAAALPLSANRDAEDVFAGLDWRRLRLRQDQQVPEWDLP